MAIINEIREQQKKLKEMTFKEKWNYFWYYYKIHTFVVLFLVVSVTIFIRDAINAKDYAFYSILLNFYSPTITQDDLSSEFAAYSEIDLNEYECFIDTSSTLNFNTMNQMDMAVSQKIMAMTQTKTIDVIVSDEAPFQSYARSMMFEDLRLKLTPEDFKKYEPYFYYVDAAELAEDLEINYDEDGTMVTQVPANPRHPEKMIDPVPVGIYVNDAPKLKEWGAYQTADAIFGFVATSQQPDNSHDFLDYIWS